MPSSGKHYRDNRFIGRQAIGYHRETPAVTAKLPWEVKGMHGIPGTGKEPSRDQAVYWVPGCPEDLMAVVEEEVFFDVNLPGYREFQLPELVIEA